MPKKAISFGDLKFDTKGEAEEFLKSMLYKYDLGDRVDDEDAVVLRGALSHHPDVAQKVGSGITHFSVRSADFGTRCFWVNRADGTSEKFSIGSCVYKKRSSSSSAT